MEVIKIIRDSDLGLDFPDLTTYEKREAARAVLFDKDKNIALLNVTKHKYHKLPGGGVEEGEDLETALRREVTEEVGCAIENIRGLGIIEEYRNNLDTHQISYCYIVDVAGEKGTPEFEQGEIADGFKLEWMSVDDAIKTLEDEIGVEDYEGKFIRLRDLTFLRAYNP